MAEVTGLPEFFQQLRTIVYGIWRKRWYMIATSWVIALLAWGIVFSMPYRYQASALVLVDTETALPAIARNLGISVDVRRQVDLVRETLATRPNLESIIQRTDALERLAQTTALREELVAYMQRRIRVQPLDANRFRIEFEIDDARLSDRQRADVAKTVVNSLLSSFLERNDQGEALKAEEAQKFLDEQITDYANRLEGADQALASFRQDNLPYLGGQDGYLQRLRAEQANMQSTERDITEMQVSLKELETQLSGIPQTVKIATRNGTPVTNTKDPLDARIEDLQKRLDELKAFGYTDRHPDVVSTNNQLQGLIVERDAQRAQLEKELAEAAGAGTVTTRDGETSNPIYEQVYLQTLETRKQIARLTRRLEAQKIQVATMEAQAKKVPEIEAEEKRLSRDYNSILNQYNELIYQREDLALKRSVAGVDSGVALQILEQPITPQSPSGPPRLLFMGFGLLAAIGVGVAVAFLLSQLRPVVLSVDQLRAHFALPVLGSVTRLVSEEESRKRSMDLLAFGGVSASLFLTFFLLTALDLFVGPTIGG